jgi:hypothetical protein
MVFLKSTGPNISANPTNCPLVLTWKGKHKENECIKNSSFYNSHGTASVKFRKGHPLDWQAYINPNQVKTASMEFNYTFKEMNHLILKIAEFAKNNQNIACSNLFMLGSSK